MKLTEVADRLEAWAEAENCLAEAIPERNRTGSDAFSIENRSVYQAAVNRRDNYMVLVAAIREELGGTNEEQGKKAYEVFSRNLNSGITPDWLSGWLEGFYQDHPTLQAKLYRELNSEMRQRHTFDEGVDTEGKHFVTCTDGRIAGDLPWFVTKGYIPFI